MDTPVTGTPRLLLRLEGLVLLAASIAAYNALGASWLLFVLLLDRTLGLRLKFSTAFRFTHLGIVGRVAPTV